VTADKISLVVLAAGLGSRYGGLKQIEPVGPEGEILLEYSVYDAIKAGFERVVFIIGEDREAFAAAIGDKMKNHIDIAYARQSLEDLPAGVGMPEGRQKPWGTAHALLAAKDQLAAPFAVINADDYYGPEAFRLAYDYLAAKAKPQEALLVNYILGNTLSPNGTVARGICEIGDKADLLTITERRVIKDGGDLAYFSEDQGETWTALDKSSPVSMNFWGFHESILEDLEQGFAPALEQGLVKDPLKFEYLLPEKVGQMVQKQGFRVQCKASHDKWYGMTYKEDKNSLAEALAKLTDQGLYPRGVWA
jgi:hypothetical protein